MSPVELDAIMKVGIAAVLGAVVGVDRERRHKPAGVSTHMLIVIAAALFTTLSGELDPSSPARVASQIVTGVGFLGAGIIVRGEHGSVANLTTAASIWLAAAIGMSVGAGWYVAATVVGVLSLLAPRLPKVGRRRRTAVLDTHQDTSGA